MSRNLKESLRKCYNSLRREGLSYGLEVVTARAAAGSALEDFFRLHSARASLSGTIRHRDVFAHPNCRAFLLDVCERFAERDALRIYRLRVADAVVATRIGFVLGHGLYLYYSGFDPAFARFGVMTTTVAEAVKDAIGEGLERVNLSTGSDVSKSRWRPEEVAFRDATLLPASPITRMKYEVAVVAQRAMREAGVGRLFTRRKESPSDNGPPHSISDGP
jgi:CelD/BcsL family acetyltransferase involved in cellulose biosynthesis